MGKFEELTFKGKTALVTGASGMIGRAISIKLAQLGADVYVHYNKSEEKAIETAQLIEKTGQKAYLVSGDLTKPDEVKNIFHNIEETSGSLDILINNAAYHTRSYLNTMKESDWDRAIDSNMKSIYLSTKYACKLLIKENNSGCVVNIASITSLKAYVTLLGYSASKAGVLEMTMVLAKELGEYGVRVNCISPGHVKADAIPEEEQSSNQELLTMLGRGGQELSEKDEKSLIDLTPLHRIGIPEDVANMVIFLCSPMSKCISGQNLIVDGGYSLDWKMSN